MIKYILEGPDMTLNVFEDRVEINPKGLLGKLGGQGNETVFIKDITSVEVRECSFINAGHIQFSGAGLNTKANKVAFGGFGDRKAMNSNALAIKTFILAQMQKIKNIPASAITALSASDELLKLAQLKDKGVLSDEEFQSAKRKLLGI